MAGDIRAHLLARDYFPFAISALSNLLMGIISLVVFILQIRRYKDEIYETPKWLRISKLAGVFGGMLQGALGYYWAYRVCFIVLYERSNSFMHFFVPVLATVTYFCFDEKDYFNWVETLFATIPLDIYGLSYLINFLSHRCGTKRSK